MPKPHGPARRAFPARAARTLPVSLLVIAATVFSTGCGVQNVFSNAWSRGQIDLVERFTTASPDPDWPYLDASDRTAEVCGPKVSCVQAVGNSYLTVLKFGDVESARDYAKTLGSDAAQIDPLVVHFNGTPVDTKTREAIVHTLSNINASSSD